MSSVSFQMPNIEGIAYLINNYNFRDKKVEWKLYCDMSNKLLTATKHCVSTKRLQIKEGIMLSNAAFSIIT